MGHDLLAGDRLDGDLDRLLGQIFAMQVTAVEGPQGLAGWTFIPGYLGFRGIAQSPEQLVGGRRLGGDGGCGRDGFGCC